jgi:hypothetical protein
MNPNLLPKQITSFIAGFDGDYGDPIGIAYEMLRLPTDASARKMATELFLNGSDFKNRNIVDIEALVKNSSQMHMNMFGKTKAAQAAALLAMTVWNPTAVGDKLTIGMMAVPIVSYNYRTALKKYTASGVELPEAKRMAADHALTIGNAFMNETQQSKMFVDVSALQQGGWKNATFFMNSVMAYSRKVFKKSRDIKRGYVSKKYKLLQENPDMNQALLAAKSMTGIKPADFIGLTIYSTLLPVLFKTVQAGGSNWAQMWDEDNKVANEARWSMFFDAGLGWTKGLLGLGFMLEYAKNSITGNMYGRESDNFIRTFDDILEIVDNVTEIGKAITSGMPIPAQKGAATAGYLERHPEKLSQFQRDNWELIKKELTKGEREYYDKLTKAYMSLGINMVGFATGMPAVEARRTQQAFMDEEFNTTLKKAVRIYGLPKDAIRFWFPTPQAQHDGEIKVAIQNKDGKRIISLYKDSFTWKDHRS